MHIKTIFLFLGMKYVMFVTLCDMALVPSFTNVIYTDSEKNFFYLFLMEIVLSARSNTHRRLFCFIEISSRISNGGGIKRLHFSCASSECSSMKTHAATLTKSAGSLNINVAVYN